MRKREPNRTATRKPPRPRTPEELALIEEQQLILRLDGIICTDPEDWTAEERQFVDEHHGLAIHLG